MAEQKKPKKASNDYKEAVGLMKAMGSTKGFDPIPPDQHAWTMHKDEPPLLRMWGWMCTHTIHWGHRSPFAVNKERHELHLEHIAADLDLDEANARHYWRLGCAKGLWRNGTDEEGRRKMFLCGQVKSEGEGTEKKEVCTNLLPPQILKQVDNWPPEKQHLFRLEFASELELEKQSAATLIAANRTFFIRRQDNLFDRYGVKANRQQHRKNGESPEEAAARRGRVEPLLRDVERCVQTFLNSVQSQNGTLYKGQNGSVQTGASLLPVETIEKAKRAGAASRSSTPPPRPGKAPSYDGEKPAKQLPAAKTASLTQAEDLDAPLTQEERQAEDLLFSEVRRIQSAFPHTDFSHELISRDVKPHRLFVRRVRLTVGTANVLPFLFDVARKFKGLDRNALAKLPARAPGMPSGPRSFGLILEWAQDWNRAHQLVTGAGQQTVADQVALEAQRAEQRFAEASVQEAI